VPTNEVYLEWIKYAEGDLEVARHITTMYKPNIEISCYHCQQCAEKALKAFLVFNNKMPKHTHDLVVLCSDCKSINCSFTELMECCFVLNQHITNTRYPGPAELDTADMEQSLEYAEKVLLLVKERTRREP
jgi:HEPN domain-containing protein